MGMCMWVLGLQSSEEGITSPGAGVTGSCEPHHVGTGNQVVWKNSLCLSGIPLEVLGMSPTGRRDCCVRFPLSWMLKAVGIETGWGVSGLSYPLHFVSSEALLAFLQELARRGVLGQGILFVLSQTSWNRQCGATDETLMVVKSLCVSGGGGCDHLSLAMGPASICNHLIKGVPGLSSSVLRKWGSPGTWINHMAREPFRTPFSHSVTQSGCVSPKPSLSPRWEKLYLPKLPNFLKHNPPSCHPSAGLLRNG